MKTNITYKFFERHVRKYFDPYLVCPLCGLPFCNEFNGNIINRCGTCQDKQIIQFGGLFCGNTEKAKVFSCECGQNNGKQKSILVLYLIILTDYIDNLEYQLVCKEKDVLNQETNYV